MCLENKPKGGYLLEETTIMSVLKKVQVTIL